MPVDYAEWEALLQDEYLGDYVKQGGAAVKFAMTDSPALHHRLTSRLSLASAEHGYLMTSVDSADTRIHLMHELFHHVARQVDWEKLARIVTRQCYLDQGLQVRGDDLRIESVAEQNGLTPGPLRVQMQRAFESLLRRNHDLARDFRYAMLWLCLAQVTRAEGGGPDAEAVLQWLRGELRLLSGVRRLLIFEKIGRHNARAMLSSLSAWCRTAGRSGLVLLVDLRQLAVARRGDAGLHYSAAACMDAYEVIRQLIDSTDDLTGFLAVVLAPGELFEDEKRGVKAYKALFERIWPDVRLKSRPNPLSALSALSALQSSEVFS